MKCATLLGIVLLSLTNEGCYGKEELQNRQLKSKKDGKSKSSKHGKSKSSKHGKSKSSKHGESKSSKHPKVSKDSKTSKTSKGGGGAKPSGKHFTSYEAPSGLNICDGKGPALAKIDCPDALGQAGTDVTEGYTGNKDTANVPITVPFYQAGLCPVNVHWHLGTEHRSEGQYDEDGSGPTGIDHRRKLAGKARKGFQCQLYDDSVDMFTKHYDWQHCTDMEVGQTYEVHWPSSAAGACGTLNQYQTPFVDGVFCKDNILVDLPAQIGVQAQVFTIVNDEKYYYPDLMRGMIVDEMIGSDIAYYTGSTTGTSHNNEICSAYAPITWQVDRKCNIVSASTFDKMCADMKSQRDDMSDDLYPHGSRELVNDANASNNHERS